MTKYKTTTLIRTIVAVVSAFILVGGNINVTGYATNTNYAKTPYEASTNESSTVSDLDIEGFIIDSELPEPAVEISYLDMINRMTDLEALAYPALPGERTSQSSSYNKLSRYDEETDSYLNWDQNWDEGYDTPQTEDGKYIFADIEGAGAIVRIWAAMPRHVPLKIYIDDNPTPIIDMPFENYFNENGVFPFNLSEISYDSNRGKNSYVPITFSKSCKIIADGRWDGGMFYQVDYISFPEGTIVEPYPSSFTDEQTKALEKVNSYFVSGLGDSPKKYDNTTTHKNDITIRAGDSAEIYNNDNSGAITGVKIKINDLLELGEDWDALAEMTISAYWDNEDKPSVWSTLGGFFSSITGINEYQSLPMGVEADGTMYAYWYMPFKDGAKIIIGNDGNTDRNISYEILSTPLSSQDAEKALRFHAKWNRMLDPAMDDNDRWPDSEFLYTEGIGRYVGTSLHIYKEIGIGDPRYHDEWWWGEGDEKFFVDGEKFPSWFGTGTEDYFGYAWGTWTFFDRPYHSQPFTNGGMFGIGNRLNNRVHIIDSVPFEKSFSANFEKYHRDWYSNFVVTDFWYLNSGGYDPYGPVSLKKRTEYYESPYPEPANFYEGEDMKIISTSGMDAGKTQDMRPYGDSWSNDMHFVLLSGIGGNVKWYINVAENGYYDLTAMFTKGNDFGIVQHYLDNERIGSALDMYDPAIIISGEVALGQKYLSAGLHVFEARVIGRNPTSSGTVYGLDYLKVEKSVGFVPTKYEGEALELIEKSDSTNVNVQQMQGWSEDAHRVLVPSDNGDGGNNFYYMTFKLPVAESGDYIVSGAMTRGSDFGIAQHGIDGKNLGNPIDFKEANVMQAPLTVLDKIYLSAGDHEFTVRMVGTSATRTPKYVYGLDYLLLTPYEKIINNNDILFEAEQAKVVDVTPGIIPCMQNLFWFDSTAWSQNTHLLMLANNPGQFMTLEIDIPKDGFYDFSTAFSKAGDFGIIQFSIDGNDIGEKFDTYNPNITHEEMSFGNLHLSKGKHKIKITVLDKNSASSGYLFAIDYFKIVSIPSGWTNEADMLIADNTAQINGTLTNNTNESVSITIMAAAYDQKGRMIDSKSKTVAIDDSELYDFDLDISNSEGAYNAKIFVYKSEDFAPVIEPCIPIIINELK